MSTITKKRRKPHDPNKDYLDRDDVYYIKKHIAQGIPYERIAANVYCDVADVERVAKRPYTARMSENANIQNIG